VAYPRVVDAEALKSSPSANPCHVHGTIFNWIFLGEETVHDMQFSVFSHSIFILLQWHGKLSILGIIL